MKTVLITGCNGGLGTSLLKKFSSNGYNVIACIFPQEQSFIDNCILWQKEYNNLIDVVAYDSSSPETLKEGIEKIIGLNKPIDVLVNNAGVSIIKPIFGVEYEDLLKTFSINYFATVMLTKTVAELMIRQEDGGNIVNVTSMVSLGSQPGGTCYDASKAALNQFTKSMAQELAAFNVRVNAVAPAPMNTPMFQNLNEKTQKNALKGIAMKRPAELEEVANAVLFLASPEASYITGSILKIDGGAIV